LHTQHFPGCAQNLQSACDVAPLGAGGQFLYCPAIRQFTAPTLKYEGLH
jgi:hypothetical protein